MKYFSASHWAINRLLYGGRRPISVGDDLVMALVQQLVFIYQLDDSELTSTVDRINGTAVEGVSE